MRDADAINDWLVELLQCPAGGGPLVRQGDRFLCRRCGLAFPIRDGIPVLLLEEAELPEGIDSVSDIKCTAKETGPASNS